MQFRLIFDDNTAVYYDNTDNSLTNSKGEELIMTRRGVDEPAHRVSPENPTIKSNELRVLKIQMGLKCNYSCSYCLQSSEIPDATITSFDDADEFIDRLDSWLVGSPDKIEFWGGEPLLYWKKIKRMLPRIRKKFPTAKFSIITNGSLFTDEIIDMFVEYDIACGISHDGPAQHLRGPDPFDDPEKLAGILKFIDRVGDGGYGFNAVISPESADTMKTLKWFNERLGRVVNVGFEGIVNDYSNGVAKRFTEEEYDVLHKSIVESAKTGELWESGYFHQSINQIMTVFQQKKHTDALWQKCGMDRPDTLSVDLKGNAMTCQNVGANGKHGIGSVYSQEPIKLDTSWHWSTRRECSSCPVLQICGGGCMYHTPDSSNWKNSCDNEFAFALAKLTVVLWQFFGKELVEIRGDIVRPDRSDNIIPTVSV